MVTFLGKCHQSGDSSAKDSVAIDDETGKCPVLMLKIEAAMCSLGIASEFVVVG
jgi:hypothetical protein